MIIITTSTVHLQIHHSQVPGVAQWTPRAILDVKACIYIAHVDDNATFYSFILPLYTGLPSASPYPALELLLQIKKTTAEWCLKTLKPNFSAVLSQEGCFFMEQGSPPCCKTQRLLLKWKTQLWLRQLDLCSTPVNTHPSSKGQELPSPRLLSPSWQPGTPLQCSLPALCAGEEDCREEQQYIAHHATEWSHLIR